MIVLQSCLGVGVILFCAWLFSEQRQSVSWRTIGGGLAVQLVLALALLKLPWSQDVFLLLNRVVLALQESLQAGTSFVFGYLGGGKVPFPVTEGSSTFVLAFQSLPLVLFISALSSLLFYWRILPLVVQGFSAILRRSLGVGGAEGLGISANVFLGMVEAPLLIRPYVNRLTRSELFTVMTCGMATIAGTVMVLYATLLGDVIPGAMGHIFAASMINAPASVVISKLLVPETKPTTEGVLHDVDASTGAMDAVTQGTLRGVQLLLNITAMLLVLVALVHLVNLILGLLPAWGGEPLTLERTLGWLLAPVVWLLGVQWDEAAVAGGLLGTKTILNELVAYLQMGQLAEGSLTDRSLLIMTYAMCGFANPGSLGIMIGGLGTMAPERRSEVVALGFRSILAGTMATCLTGALVGVLTGF